MLILRNELIHRFFGLRDVIKAKIELVGIKAVEAVGAFGHNSLFEVCNGFIPVNVDGLGFSMWVPIGSNKSAWFS